MTSRISCLLFGFLYGLSVFAAPPTGAPTEYSVELEGVYHYSRYHRFKEALTAALPSAKVEERAMSPGRVTFVVTGAGLSNAELGEKLRRLQPAGAHLVTQQTSPGRFLVSWK